MFREIGTDTDYAALGREFERWLAEAMARQLYHGWMVEASQGDIAAGGGLTVVPWPPAPNDFGNRVAFIYNIYTEPPHRRRGLARRLMLTMHDWCLTQGIRTVRLHASNEGRPLYESLGYQSTNEMIMRLG
jgi:GNAT superfamily N-acetyltransferase